MDHARETIERLCTLAGMILEDTVDIALLRGRDPLDQRLRQLAEAGRDIVALAEAAAIISRRHNTAP